MRLIVVGVALVWFGCEGKKAETPAPETSVPVEKQGGDVKDNGATATRQKGGDDVPDDLLQLAEMPELTAEATPEEIDRRINKVMDGFEQFVDAIAKNDDCNRMGADLTRFVAANKRLFENLQLHSKNPKVNERLQQAITQRGPTWLSKLGNNLNKCMTNPAVMSALMQLSKNAQQ